MRRLVIRPGAIGDCIVSMPAMQHLCAEYTEIWISSPVVPLVHFADRVTSITSTGLDMLGIQDQEVDPRLLSHMRSFDHIVSWYGTNRPEFRQALIDTGVCCEFLAALPPADCTEHATDFFCRQVGAPLGQAPGILTERAKIGRAHV